MKARRSTDDFAITPVERRYQERLNAMTGMEKMQRAQALCEGMWEMLAHKVMQEKEGLSERDLHYFVAQRIYVNEPDTLRKLEQVYNNGS
ncbi:MAG: hypothetical protein QM758_17665 [Armatimonas sp.]